MLATLACSQAEQPADSTRMRACNLARHGLPWHCYHCSSSCNLHFMPNIVKPNATALSCRLVQDPKLMTYFAIFLANTLSPDVAAPQHTAHLQRPAAAVASIASLLVGSCIEPQRPAVLSRLLAMLHNTRQSSDACSMFVRDNSSASFDFLGTLFGSSGGGSSAAVHPLQVGRCC